MASEGFPFVPDKSMIFAKASNHCATGKVGYNNYKTQMVFHTEGMVSCKGNTYLN
jgi:hypothetical protein